MQSPARSRPSAYARQNRNSAGPLIALGVLVLIGLGIFLTVRLHSKSEIVTNGPVAVVHPVAEKPVHLVFEPPIVHNDLQDANQKMVVDIVNDPSSWGLKDKAPIKELTGNVLQVYLSTLETDNHFYHYNSNGDVQLSYTKTAGETPCCAGIGQVYTLTSVCEGWELKDIRRNAWCSARIFADYYNEYKVKAPARSFELTVARYKNAVLLDDNGNMVLDQDGLPIIPGDENVQDSPRSQVDRVFVYTDDNGEKHSIFRFVND